MRRLIWIFVCAAIPQPHAAQAQSSAKVVGLVKKVDRDTGTITVRSSRKAAIGDETFNLLRKDIEVMAPSGQKAGLDTVAPGQSVQLKLDAGGDVEAITIQTPVYAATVVALDLEKRSVTIDGEESGQRTMTLADDARVSLGRPAYLREVKLGSRMTVTASLDGKTALGLTLLSDPDGKLATKLFPRVRTSRLPGLRLAGVLADVDPQRREIKFVGPKTKGVVQTMPLAENAVVQALHGQVAMENAALNQLAKSIAATIYVSNQTVIRIVVDSPVSSAKVRTLDGNAGRLTALLDGREATFVLPPGIKVMQGTLVRHLPDVKPDATVSLVFSVDRARLLAIDLR